MTVEVRSAEQVLNLGVNMNDAVRLHEAVNAGIPAAAITRLESLLDASVGQIVALLCISETTRKRLKRAPRQRLTPEVSDRLVRILHVFNEAVEVLGTPEKARSWLGKRSYALGNRAPIDLLTTAPGVHLVLDELNTIKYGNWA